MVCHLQELCCKRRSSVFWRRNFLSDVSYQHIEIFSGFKIGIMDSKALWIHNSTAEWGSACFIHKHKSLTSVGLFTCLKVSSTSLAVLDGYCRSHVQSAQWSCHHFAHLHLLIFLYLPNYGFHKSKISTWR